MCLCVCVLCVQEKPVLIFFSASLPFVVEKMCWKRKEQTKKIFAQLRAAPLCSLSLYFLYSKAQRGATQRSSEFIGFLSCDFIIALTLSRTHSWWTTATKFMRNICFGLQLPFTFTKQSTTHTQTQERMFSFFPFRIFSFVCAAPQREQGTRCIAPCYACAPDGNRAHLCDGARSDYGARRRCVLVCFQPPLWVGQKFDAFHLHGVYARVAFRKSSIRGQRRKEPPPPHSLSCIFFLLQSTVLYIPYLSVYVCVLWRVVHKNITKKKTVRKINKKKIKKSKVRDV